LFVCSSWTTTHAEPHAPRHPLPSHVQSEMRQLWAPRTECSARQQHAKQSHVMKGIQRAPAAYLVPAPQGPIPHRCRREQRAAPLVRAFRHGALVVPAGRRVRAAAARDSEARAGARHRQEEEVAHGLGPGGSGAVRDVRERGRADTGPARARFCRALPLLFKPLGSSKRFPAEMKKKNSHRRPLAQSRGGGGRNTTQSQGQKTAAVARVSRAVRAALHTGPGSVHSLAAGVSAGSGKHHSTTWDDKVG